MYLLECITQKNALNSLACAPDDAPPSDCSPSSNCDPVSEVCSPDLDNCTPS